MTKSLSYLVLISVGLTACTLATDPIPAGPIQIDVGAVESSVPEQPPDLVSGQQTFEERCASCHGLDGGGKGQRRTRKFPAVPVCSQHNSLS